MEYGGREQDSNWYGDKKDFKWKFPPTYDLGVVQ